MIHDNTTTQRLIDQSYPCHAMSCHCCSGSCCSFYADVLFFLCFLCSCPSGFNKFFSLCVQVTCTPGESGPYPSLCNTDNTSTHRNTQASKHNKQATVHRPSTRTRTEKH